MGWFDLIQEYDIEIKHSSGENMAHLVVLNRMPLEETIETLNKLVEDHLEILIAMEEPDFVRSM